MQAEQNKGRLLSVCSPTYRKVRDGWGTQFHPQWVGKAGGRLEAGWLRCPGLRAEGLAGEGGEGRGLAEGGFEVGIEGEVMAESAVEDVSGAEGVFGVDWGGFDFEAASALPAENGFCAARDGDIGNVLRGEPGKDGFRPGGMAGNGETLAADGGGEQGGELFG